MGNDFSIAQDCPVPVSIHKEQPRDLKNALHRYPPPNPKILPSSAASGYLDDLRTVCKSQPRTGKHNRDMTPSRGGLREFLGSAINQAAASFCIGEEYVIVAGWLPLPRRTMSSDSLSKRDTRLRNPRNRTDSVQEPPND